MPPRASHAVDASTGALPGAAAEPVRAAVTFALAIYLFGLALCVIGNTSSGASLLVRTIKGKIFTPVLAPAWLDLGFDYPFTYGLPEDADHVLEVAPFGDPAARLRFPADMAGERARRWRRLARAITETGGDPDRTSRVAAGVAAAMFDAFGPDVRLRVLRRARADVGGVDPGRLDEAFAARVREIDGDVQLIRDEPAGAVAPIVVPRRDPADGAESRP